MDYPQTIAMNFYLSMGICAGYLSVQSNLESVVGNVKEGNINRHYIEYLHTLLGDILRQTEETNGPQNI